MLISIALIGRVNRGQAVSRGGALPGQALFVTGELGGSLEGRHLDFQPRLAEGAWLIAPVSRDVVFGVDPDAMWDHVLRSLGIEPSTLVASRGVH